MRKPGLLLVSCVAGATHAAPAPHAQAPLANGFDLTSLSVQPPALLAGAPKSHSEDRWLLHEIEPPPGPSRDPPRVRFRGKHVKCGFRSETDR